MKVPIGIKHFQHILKKAAMMARIGGRRVAVIKATQEPWRCRTCHKHRSKFKHPTPAIKMASRLLPSKWTIKTRFWVERLVNEVVIPLPISLCK